MRGSVCLTSVDASQGAARDCSTSRPWQSPYARIGGAHWSSSPAHNRVPYSRGRAAIVVSFAKILTPGSRSLAPAAKLLTHAAKSLTPATTTRPPRGGQWDLPTGLGVTWLGTSSGQPTLSRNVSCTLVRLPEAIYVIDCGEGSARQLLATGLDPAQVERIFITHLHGDHCFGLAGMLRLIDAAHAKGGAAGPRQLSVYGPPGIAKLLHTQLVDAGGVDELALMLHIVELGSRTADGSAHHSVGGSSVRVSTLGPSPLTAQQYEWLVPPRNGSRRLRNTFVPLQGVYWDIPCAHVSVAAAQLQHRVPCWGYVFEERQPHPHGQRSRKVAVLGDTMDSSSLVPLARGVDMLSHEATFSCGMEHTAEIAQHSTGAMAGAFAAALGARALVLTHFSARYGGTWRPQISAAQEDLDHSRAVLQLMHEARRSYGSDQVFAARDFYTYHVPVPEA